MQYSLFTWCIMQTNCWWKYASVKLLQMYFKNVGQKHKKNTTSNIGNTMSKYKEGVSSGTWKKTHVQLLNNIWKHLQNISNTMNHTGNA